MKRYFAAAALALLAGPAFAFQCPADMAKIDEALAAGTTLDEAQLGELLWTLVAVAQRAGLNAEDALRSYTVRYKTQVQKQQ